MNDSIKMLFIKLNNHGGLIIPSSECNPLEIAQSRANENFHVDTDGFGYVYVPHTLQQILDIERERFEVEKNKLIHIQEVNSCEKDS